MFSPPDGADGALDPRQPHLVGQHQGCTVYKARTGPLGITIVTQPATRSVWVSLAGDVVMGTESALADAIEQLSRPRPDVVTLDLTAVTFVCSTFANFVADVHTALPDASILLHDPSRMARLVLAITGLDTVLTRYDDTAPVYFRIPRPY